MKEFIIKYQVIIFFILSAVIGYAPWIFMGKPIWLIWGMSVSGALLTFYLDGKSGLLKILKRAVPKKEDIKPLICIPLFFIIADALALLIAYILFKDIPGFEFIRKEPLYIPVFIIATLLGGPLAEELFGLRGYALPKLLEKMKPVPATLIVGLFFGAWHFIEFNDPGSTQYALGMRMYPFFILIEIALSILMTWLYQTSAAPLFIGGIYCHLSMNVINCLMTTKITFSTLAGVAPTNNHYIVIFGIEMIACAVLLIIKTRGQLK
jgi:uncharacterized protein